MLKNGAPVKNMWVNVSPKGVSYPDVGGGARGVAAAYTDNAGRAYFTNIPSGEYSIAILDNSAVQLKHVIIAVSETGTATHVVNLE